MKYQKDDIKSQEDIENESIYVIKCKAPVFVEAIDHWVDCLTWTGPEDVYYDAEHPTANYIKVLYSDNFFVCGELVLIPPQTANKEVISVSSSNCFVKINICDLWHKLTEEELKPKKLYFMDFYSINTQTLKNIN
jgi:hypothetical protein